MSRSLRTIYIVLALAASAHASDNWPARAVGRNARAMAATGDPKACAQVAPIPGANTWCLAVIRKDLALCSSLKDQQAQEMCKFDVRQ